MDVTQPDTYKEQLNKMIDKITSIQSLTNEQMLLVNDLHTVDKTLLIILFNDVLKYVEQFLEEL